MKSIERGKDFRSEEPTSHTIWLYSRGVHCSIGTGFASYHSRGGKSCFGERAGEVTFAS
ncbi:MAG: hypothetical protein J0L83_09405 [Chitinophagales bacterium]|nr:hypothetical protein [Chitinophagales bacterium]